MFIKEIWINATEGYQCGDSGLYEPFTDNIAKLFRNLQKRCGRCISKCMIDKADGTAKQIGWVFEKRRKYEDCNKTYIAQTWIELHEKQPTKTCTNHFIELDG